MSANSVNRAPTFAAAVLRAFVAWLLILGLAIVNGVLREAVLVAALGATPGLALSGVILMACVLGVALLLVARLGTVSKRTLLAIGMFWLALTLGFEFGFGRAVAHKSWAQLLDAYALRDGNLWPLVLLVVVVAPLFADWLRRRGQR